jgi:hypothetical protein
MYEIRCIVGDKKLRDVLVFLTNNNTLEPPVVIPTGPPLTNGLDKLKKDAAKAPMAKKPQKKSFKHGGKHTKGRGATEIVRDLLTKTGATRIFAREMREAAVAAGYSTNAYSNAIKVLLADNTIRRAKGLFGVYDVVNPTQK